MKKKAIVIDDGYRRFMRTRPMSEKIDVPIICLDEDDNDDLMIDKDYNVFLDHLRRGDNDSLTPRLEVDNGESDIRRLKIFSCDSKRPKLGNENPVKNRVHQQGKRRTVGFKAERVNIRENIQRDNRVAERRKRRIAELEAAKTSRDVPSLKTQQEDTQQRDNKVRKLSESKAETLRRDDVPLVGTQEDSQRDHTVSQGRKRNNDDALRRDVPLVETEEDIQRDHTVSQGRKRKHDELGADTLRRDVPLVRRTEEDIQQDNMRVAAETSEVVRMERVNRVTEVNDVVETSSRSKEVFVGRKNKNEDGSEAVVDKNYMRYLTWLVDSLRDSSTTEPMENLQKDQSDLDTLKESTMVPEMDPLVEVKVEPDHDWSDYIIAMGDSPFLDGEECTPFVVSKKVVDLDEGSKEDESSSSWFRKELMDVLQKPYDEGELKLLHRYASIHRKMTRCRELRKGRESDYETDELGQSYLESFPDFEKEYKLVVGVDKARALKLLRGFFLYLKYVSHDGVFKPWERNQRWQT
ncbi:uncharacterized protein LOC9318613 [Arabidopsis lyrata subsp. lyrata]|uniref:uncharacterized protein LOC9318613 n=1 Tax=Arabidopsis lyrata subsp. lyrata TaxID=81972 RepID=UPI000A29B29F|nr:uncharacterized protein LOC9318613 [Arabidopsis lyrata subsp. lyrata]|eukprot:XP_020886957.1 uncharacterized protein LOC9318613 [Arabidopsis lyrata subsp. lyrata]